MIQLIDRIDRIHPRVGDRPAGKRQRRPFPPVGDEDDAEHQPDERPSDDEPSSPKSSRSPQPEDDSDEHLVDITVLGRFLPGGQFLPGCGDAVIRH